MSRDRLFREREEVGRTVRWVNVIDRVGGRAGFTVATSEGGYSTTKAGPGVPLKTL